METRIEYTLQHVESGEDLRDENEQPQTFDTRAEAEKALYELSEGVRGGLTIVERKHDWQPSTPKSHTDVDKAFNS